MKYLLVFSVQYTKYTDESCTASVEKEIYCEPSELKEEISDKKEEVKFDVRQDNDHIYFTETLSEIFVSLVQVVPL